MDDAVELAAVITIAGERVDRGVDTRGAGFKLLPASGTMAADGRLLLRIEIFPETVPADTGWNETSSTVCSSGARDNPGDNFEKTKPAPVTVTPEIVSGISPVFRTVIFFLLCEFSCRGPKSREGGESRKAASGALPTPVSVKEVIDWALLTISRIAEIFPDAIG